MKKTVVALILLTRLAPLLAQLPNGSIAPDFNVLDITGQPRHLYEMLNEGKIVLLEISATWCPPCWSYHNSDALQLFYNVHGPLGDNQARVLFIEGDPNTNVDCLYGLPGCNDFSPGNWVSGTTYPYIDNAAIADAFAVSYYPSIFAICPNKKVYTLGQLSANDLWEKAKECPVKLGSFNAGIFNYDPGTPLHEICDTLNISPAFTLINLGDSALTNAKIQLEWNGNVLEERNWNGYLPTYGETNIYFNPQAVSGDGNLKTVIKNINGDKTDVDFSNNVENSSFVEAVGFNHQQVILRLRTDNYGAETYWELRDAEGKVLDHGGNESVGPNGGGSLSNAPIGYGAYGNNVLIKDTLTLPKSGCYSLHFVDYYGDGICCNFGNGYYKLYNINNPAIPLLSGGEFKAYDDRGWGVFSVTSTNALQKTAVLEVFPNPAADQLHLYIEYPEPAPITSSILDPLGATVYVFPAQEIPSSSTQIDLDIARLPAGMYYLQIQIGTQRIIRKFVHLND